MISEGSRAPDFELELDDGSQLRLSSLRGKPVVVYFYPKDDTSGCTAEAKDFSSFHSAFDSAGARVIGISPDSVHSHQKFKRKHELTVSLASDERRDVLEAWGVWVEKSMYGRKYMGVERSTFLIDGKGTVVRCWRKVKVPGHVKEVLDALEALRGK